MGLPFVCVCSLSWLLGLYDRLSNTARISVLWPEVGRCADTFFNSGGVRDVIGMWFLRRWNVLKQKILKRRLPNQHKRTMRRSERNQCSPHHHEWDSYVIHIHYLRSSTERINDDVVGCWMREWHSMIASHDDVHGFFLLLYWSTPSEQKKTDIIHLLYKSWGKQKWHCTFINISSAKYFTTQNINIFSLEGETQQILPNPNEEYQTCTKMEIQRAHVIFLSSLQSQEDDDEA